MANVKVQADNCIELFKGSPIMTVKRGINALSAGVVNELCSRFNCDRDSLAVKLSEM